MTPEQHKPGLRVWYEPSCGIRFLGELVDEAPRKLGDAWVTTVAMSSPAYGEWRRQRPDGDVRMSVPSAALDRLFVDAGTESDKIGRPTCDTPDCGRPIPVGGEGYPEICPECLDREERLERVTSSAPRATREERHAWDAHAAAFATAMPCDVDRDVYPDAAAAARYADEMLAERRKRFGGGT